FVDCPLFLSLSLLAVFFFFFSTATASPEIYTLSLHDALPILLIGAAFAHASFRAAPEPRTLRRSLLLVGGVLLALVAYSAVGFRDRKSTRLNSSHVSISYAVFCLKKKKKKIKIDKRQKKNKLKKIYNNNNKSC